MEKDIDVIKSDVIGRGLISEEEWQGIVKSLIEVNG